MKQTVTIVEASICGSCYPRGVGTQLRKVYRHPITGTLHRRSFWRDRRGFTACGRPLDKMTVLAAMRGARMWSE